MIQDYSLYTTDYFQQQGNAQTDISDNPRLGNGNKEPNRTLLITLQESECRIGTAQQPTDFQPRHTRLNGTPSNINSIRIPRTQHSWWLRRARSRRRLLVIRRLLRSTSAKRISCESKMPTAIVRIRQGALIDSREQEFKRAGLVDGGRWDDEVEDGAEIAGGYEWDFRGAECYNRCPFRHGHHECWVEILPGESPVRWAL